MAESTPVRNPRTGEDDFVIQPYGREDVEREADHVRTNQPAWAADLDLRIATLEAWKDELVKARGDIAEAYDLMKRSAGMTGEAMADVLKQWNATEELSSFLVEITEIKSFREILPSMNDIFIQVVQDDSRKNGLK